VLEHAFPVGNEVYPWGTTVEHVDRAWTATRAAAGLPAPFGTYQRSRHSIFVPLDSMFGIPVIGVQLWGRAPARPVVRVVYELAPDQGLEGEAGFARVRAVFDGELDEVPERWLAAHGTPTTHTVAGEWSSGSTKVHVGISYEARSWLVDEHNRLRSSGAIRFERDEQSLMQPYLDAKRETVHPWDASPGEVEIIAAPGLRTGRRGEGPDPGADSWIATLDDGFDTPQWVADRLGPDQVAIWTHAGAGVWGFGDVRLSRVVAAAAPARFVHHRCLQSRGEGHAQIPPVVTAPGPAGLDAAAQALVRRGVQLSVQEYPDE
jgi:hypothetical protein